MTIMPCHSDRLASLPTPTRDNRGSHDYGHSVDRLKLDPRGKNAAWPAIYIITNVFSR
jgi:hypothetical protein